MERESRASVLIFAVCLSLGATIAAMPLGAAPPVALRVLRDIPYTPGPAADPRLQTLDLYLPEGKSNFPTILFIHGGGLMRGDKLPDGFHALVDFFAAQGIGVASANYRLSPAAKHPAHVQDVARAFAWLHQNAAQYQMDRNRLFVVGHSAGAYLVALLALNKDFLTAEGLSPQAIRGVAALSGGYDRINTRGAAGAPSNPEPIYGTRDRALLRPSSPAHLVGTDKQIPPFLITYTDHDLYGVAEQGRRFYSLFLRHKLAADLFVVSDRDHYNQIPGIGRPLPRQEESGTRDPSGLLAEDSLGPALLHFVNGVLRGLPAANFLLSSATPPMKTLKDVAYSTGPGADPKFHSMDLYLPEGKTNFPLVFYIHGGGWRAGDKTGDGFENFVATFAKAGVGVASTNYRLSPAAKHPAHIQDVAKAFAWLSKNASQYGIDRNRLFVAGHSAGGHLAALVALDPQYLRAEGLSPSVIRGVIGSSGVYDMANLSEVGVIPSRREQSFADDPKVWEQASPLRLAHAQAPPFLITYVETDLFTLREDAQNFYAALRKRGAPAELAHIPGRHHLNAIAGMGQQIGQVDDLLGPSMVRFVLRRLAESDETVAQR